MKALVPKPYHFINLYPEKHEYTNPYLKLYFSQSFQTSVLPGPSQGTDS
jgi:hypothetical protein